MIGSISWELNLQDTTLTIRSVEVEIELNSHLCESRCFIVGDHGLFQDVYLGSSWNSDTMGGSKRISLMAHTFSGGKSTLMRAKAADKGIVLRMVVKLQGEPTILVEF